MDHVPGTIYLIHLDRPYKHAKHYLGWATDLDARLAEHEHGTGARLLQVVRDAGIGWQLARTWDGDRYRERQLKRQGGRSRMCPVCKHAASRAREVARDTAAPAGQAEPSGGAEPAGRGGIFQASLPADRRSARQARSAVRRALAAWGVDDPSGDAELLTSELVANAAEHAAGSPIGLALRRNREPGGQKGITCEVTDTSPDLPRPRQAGPDDERGRGLAIVTALATASGVRPGRAGKTSWFTLALRDRQGAARRATRQAAPEPEAEAGA